MIEFRISSFDQQLYLKTERIKEDELDFRRKS